MILMQLVPLAALTMALSRPSPEPLHADRSRNDTTHVILLGTGTPVPDPGVMGPATVVTYGDREFLFDAGVAVERQLNKAQLSFVNIEAVFLTHLHSDHTLGLPDVIFTSWVFGRKLPLKLYGPSGTKAMTDHLVAAYSEDIKARTEGPERAIPGGYRVDAKDLTSGLVYDSAGVRVRAIAVPHIAGSPALAYRIDTPDRSVVISGDIGPTDILVEFARNVDILVYEVVNMDDIEGKMPGGSDAREYMRTAHTPAPMVGEIAKKIHPGVLVLTHIISFGSDEKKMIAAVRAGGYQGRIVFGRDLDRF